MKIINSTGDIVGIAVTPAPTSSELEPCPICRAQELLRPIGRTVASAKLKNQNGSSKKEEP